MTGNFFKNLLRQFTVRNLNDQNTSQCKNMQVELILSAQKAYMFKLLVIGNTPFKTALLNLRLNVGLRDCNTTHQQVLEEQKVIHPLEFINYGETKRYTCTATTST